MSTRGSRDSFDQPKKVQISFRSLLVFPLVVALLVIQYWAWAYPIDGTLFGEYPTLRGGFRVGAVVSVGAVALATLIWCVVYLWDKNPKITVWRKR